MAYILEILLFGFLGVFALLAGRMLRIRTTLVAASYIVHTLFCLIYWYSTKTEVADSIAYYYAASVGNVELALGTAAIKYATYILVDWLSMSYLACFALYSFLGLLGLLLLAATLRDVLQNKRLLLAKYSWVVLFIPGLNFWTVAIGKDAPIFFAISLIVYSSLSITKRMPLFVFGALVVFVIRPHIALAIVPAFAVAFLMRSRVNPVLRSIILAVVLVLGAVAIPLVMSFTSIDALTVDDVSSYVDKRQSYNMGGSGIDLTGSPWYVIMFGYMFRPLFFDASNIFGLLASVENAFLLSLFLLYARSFPGGFFRYSDFSFRFNVIFLLIVWVMLSMGTANLGVAVRQKTMMLPSLFLLFSIVAVHRGASVKRTLRIRT